MVVTDATERCNAGRAEKGRVVLADVGVTRASATGVVTETVSSAPVIGVRVIEVDNFEPGVDLIGTFVLVVVLGRVEVDVFLTIDVFGFALGFVFSNFDVSSAGFTSISVLDGTNTRVLGTSYDNGTRVGLVDTAIGTGMKVGVEAEVTSAGMCTSALVVTV